MRTFIYLGLIGLAWCGPAWAADAPAEAAAAQTTEIAPRGDVTAVTNWAEAVMFYGFAIIIVGAGIGVVVSASVVRMAVWLFTSFSGVALLFFLLQAFFLGAVQLIVYVGGILVLIVFGIMLTSSSPWLKFEIKKYDLALSGTICVALFAILAYVLLGSTWNSQGQLTEGMQMATLGKRLLTDYLVPFEVASVLLLVVMIGAAYLAKQERN